MISFNSRSEVTKTMHTIFAYHAPITTKYLGPTNYKGSRISASDGTRRVIVSYDPALDSFPNHLAAAEKVFQANPDIPVHSDFVFLVTESPEKKGWQFIPLRMNNSLRLQFPQSQRASKNGLKGD